MADDGVTLTELAEQTGESPRTLRFYVMQGLLRGPDAAGPRARYPMEHVARVHWIRARQAEGLSLGRIARDLQALDAAGLPLPKHHAASAPKDATAATGRTPALDYLVAAGLLPRPAQASSVEPSPPAEPSAPAGAFEGGRTSWERLTLSEGVELHVRRPLDPATHRRVKQLLQQARETFRKP